MYLPTRLPETETRADPFSLDALIAWLRTKNPEESYDFWDCMGGCLLGQYLVATGLGWSVGNYARLDRAAAGEIIYSHPRTFGAALSRATAIRGV